MKAFIVDRYKSNSALRLGEMPEPEVRDHDVLVAIHAAGLNQLDAKIRDGEFKLILPYRLPLILGNDVAGVVVRVGSKVRGFKSGDEVYARPNQDRIGTFAELIAMNEADVALKPKNLTMEEAASIPLVGLTAWQVLIERAQLKKGQKVLIHAGSGGVGTFAIQLAKHIGATVATTTSTANVDLVRSLGADVVIDYKKEDFSKVLNGYDVVLNSLGTDTLEQSLKVLRPGGKLISISGPPDMAFAKESGLNWFMQQVTRLLSFGIRRKAKRHGVSYSFVFMRANGEQLSKITSLIESGVIRPVMDRIFPFQATNEAMDYLATGRAKGKVVINMNDTGLARTTTGASAWRRRRPVVNPLVFRHCSLRTANGGGPRLLRHNPDMHRHVVMLLCLLATLMAAAAPCAAAAERVLVFSKTAGYRHDSIPTAVATLQRLATEAGLVADHSEDAGDFNATNLARYRVVVFASTTGDVLDPAQQQALEDFMRRGGGFVGVHSAADTEYDWPWYGRLVGAYFLSHPPGLQSSHVQPERNGRPVGTAWPIRDELYNYRSNPRRQVQVVATVDERRYEGGTMGADHPITWCHAFAGGRSWYTGLGHDAALYDDPDFLAQLRRGLRYAAGQSVDC